MIITKELLKEKNACREGYEYVVKQGLIGLNDVEFIKSLIKCDNKKGLNWANWIIVRIMSYKQYVSYAVYAAEQVIDIYEKKNPDNKAPRKAIEAAKKCILNPSDENKKAAADAADAAAYAADGADGAAAYAAYAADGAAYAAYAADGADYAAAYAADAAAARKIMQIKIITYGLELLENN